MIACITRLLGGRYIVYNNGVEIEGLWIIESNHFHSNIPFSTSNFAYSIIDVETVFNK
jgi:hypothetical protein